MNKNMQILADFNSLYLEMEGHYKTCLYEKSVLILDKDSTISFMINLFKSPYCSYYCHINTEQTVHPKNSEQNQFSLLNCVGSHYARVQAL